MEEFYDIFVTKPFKKAKCDVGHNKQVKITKTSLKNHKKESFIVLATLFQIIRTKQVILKHHNQTNP